MLLVDQLDLLGATMDKVADAINRSDAGDHRPRRLPRGEVRPCLDRWFLGLGAPDPTPGPGSSPITGPLPPE